MHRVVQIEDILAARPGSVVTNGNEISVMIVDELTEDRLRRSTRVSPPVGEFLEKDDSLDGQSSQWDEQYHSTRQ